MSMNDPIADLLTRIRNACMVSHRTVDVPTSRIKCDILDVLKSEGYINGYQSIEGSFPLSTRIYLRYFKHEPVIKHIRRLSTPGLRRYVKSKDIRPIKGGLGMSVLSTPDGVVSDRKARKDNVGGELLLEIW